MRTSIVIDDALMAEALAASGCQSKREVVEESRSPVGWVARPSTTHPENNKSMAGQPNMVVAGVLGCVPLTPAVCRKRRGRHATQPTRLDRESGPEVSFRP